ncbi:intradiol ring-cleavage dioxygenase [Mycena sanguinolenta]|nr:intradiol ring-cleavage dioxygenase [Mycena sanguinolenta]
MSQSHLHAKKLAAEHGIDLSKLPQFLDMSAENITENVHAINSNCPDERMKSLFKSLVTHLHDFVRETSLTTEEWMIGLEFLTKTGEMSSDLRREFIGLSDALGISSLVLSMNDAKPPGATESTVLGPFFTTNALEFENGESIASEGKRDYLWVEGKVLDTKGNPIPNCLIHTWYSQRGAPDCRGRLYTKEDGSFFFRAIVQVPVPYPVPDDGPSGQLFKALGRHLFRPAHLHMMLEAPGFQKLTTALYFKGDPFLASDAVFGVKSSLIVETTTETNIEVTRARGFKEATTHQVLKHNFVLATVEEGAEARKRSTSNNV